MSDRLSQLQLCLDQLLDIFFSGLSYVDSHHSVVKLDPNDPQMNDPEHTEDDPQLFQDSLNELSRDIIIKTRQILTTIDTLPGVGVSEKDQLETIQKLKGDLTNAEIQKNSAIDRKEILLEYVNELILDISKDFSNSK